MKNIDFLNNNPKQAYTVQQENGDVFNFNIEYKPTQQKWYYDVIKDDLTIINNELVISPNILKQYTNILNFGIMVYSNDFIDPFDLNDFITNRVSLYLLNENDIEDVELGLFTLQDSYTGQEIL